MNEIHDAVDSTGFGPKLLDTKAVAELLNVSQSWVRDHSRRKGPEPRLPAIKFGSGKTAVVRFHPADILAFIDAQRKESGAGNISFDRWKN